MWAVGCAVDALLPSCPEYRVIVFSPRFKSCCRERCALFPVTPRNEFFFCRQLFAKFCLTSCATTTFTLLWTTTSWKIARPLESGTKQNDAIKCPMWSTLEWNHGCMHRWSLLHGFLHLLIHLSLASKQSWWVCYLKELTGTKVTGSHSRVIWSEISKILVDVALIQKTE